MKTVKFLLIQTVSNSHFKVYENGDIQRLDIPHKPSGQWKLTSLDKSTGTLFLTLKMLFAKAEEGAFVEFKSHLEKAGQIYLMNANKTAHYFVRDNDHGTARNWSDGVRKITLGQEEVSEDA